MAQPIALDGAILMCDAPTVWRIIHQIGNSEKEGDVQSIDTVKKIGEQTFFSYLYIYYYLNLYFFI